MVVQTKLKAASSNMFIILHLDLISDLEALETGSLSGPRGLKKLGAVAVPKDKSCAASGCDADHVSSPLAGRLLKRGLMLTHLTWLFLPQFIYLFCFLFCFVLSSHIQPFISCAGFCY